MKYKCFEHSITSVQIATSLAPVGAKNEKGWIFEKMLQF